MSDEDEGCEPHVHGFAIPVGQLEQIRQQHDTQHARARDRYNNAMRFLDGLDVDGLMAMRYFFATEPDEAYGHCRLYEGMVFQRLRDLGVNPQTGVDEAAQMLQNAAVEVKGSGE